MHTTIAIDTTIKERASKRAKTEHLPLSTVTGILLTDYAEGRISIGTRSEQTVRAEVVDVDEEVQEKMDGIVLAWNKHRAV